MPFCLDADRRARGVSAHAKRIDSAETGHCQIGSTTEPEIAVPGRVQMAVASCLKTAAGIAASNRVNRELSSITPAKTALK